MEGLRVAPAYERATVDRLAEAAHVAISELRAQLDVELRRRARAEAELATLDSDGGATILPFDRDDGGMAAVLHGPAAAPAVERHAAS